MDDMQSRIAARRAEIERQRAEGLAAAKAIDAELQAEAKAIADREWAERARAEKARMEDATAATAEPTAVPQNQAVMDRLIREAVWRKWNSNQKKGVGVTVAAGILLLVVNPLWGIIALTLGCGMYVAIRSKHRDAVREQYPDLFLPADAIGADYTLWQKLWWKPTPPDR